MTPQERDQIVRGVYRHFCMMLMEILHLPRKLHLVYLASLVVLDGLRPRCIDQLDQRQSPAHLLDGPLRQLGAGRLSSSACSAFPRLRSRARSTIPTSSVSSDRFRERTGQ